MTDTQVDRTSGSGRRAFGLLTLVLLSLFAGAAGGLSYAWWSTRYAPSASTPGAESPRSEADREQSPEIHRDYVKASEIGLYGGTRRVMFPAGYKVRIMCRIWTGDKFDDEIGDQYVRIADGNGDGEFEGGVRTFDPSALQRDPGRAIKVSFSGTSIGRVGWVERGPCTSGIQHITLPFPLNLSDEYVGKDCLLSMVGYGRGKYPFSRMPTANDLKESGLYVAVWVRLEKLTPEDQNKNWEWFTDSGFRRWGIRDIDPEEREGGSRRASTQPTTTTTSP